MIVTNFINSTATCGIIAPKERFKYLNSLQTWACLNVGKLNVNTQSRHTGTSIISLINYFPQLSPETCHISHLIFHRLSLQFSTSVSVILYLVNSLVDNCTSGASSSAFFINAEVLIHHITIFFTIILSANISRRYLSVIFHVTLSMLFFSAVFILGE